MASLWERRGMIFMSFTSGACLLTCFTDDVFLRDSVYALGLCYVE